MRQIGKRTVQLFASKHLGFAVIAEGIETEEQERELRALRCTYAQGYCLADILVLGRAEELVNLYQAHPVHDDSSLGLCAEVWCVMPCVGKRLYLAVDAGPICDEGGKLIAVVETLRDMTEQKLAQTALQSLAIKDGLTGIANRRSFDETLMAARPARIGTAVAASCRHRPLQTLQRHLRSPAR